MKLEKKRKKKEKEREREKKKKRGKKEEEEEEEEEENNGLTASHPSVKGQRPQERWIGAHWESQETPVAQLPTFGFGPHYRLPAFCL